MTTHRSVHRSLSALIVFLAASSPAHAWWGFGHETISRGAVVNLRLSPSESFNRFFGEVAQPYSRLPHIEPAGLHYIDIDTAVTTSVSGTSVSYAGDFAALRTGTLNFPLTTAAANARYGTSYINANGGVPWLANDTLNSLTSRMQSATTYRNWYDLLTTAASLSHYLQDMHNPMHLTQNYNPGGLHGYYEGGQFENGSVSRYPELQAAIVPTAPVYYGTAASGNFVRSLFNNIPASYDLNTPILTADTAARRASSNLINTTYYDSLWASTNTFTKQQFSNASAVVANAIYTAYVNAGSPTIPAPTFYATAATENSTITSTGEVKNFTNEDYFSVTGRSSYGVVRFDLSDIKARYDAQYGIGNWTVDTVALALQVNSVISGATAVYLAPNDQLNIQSNTALRFADNGTPLGVNTATDLPLLQISQIPTNTPKYQILRYDATTTYPFNASPLYSDILTGGITTLLFIPTSNQSSISLFGGGGLALEVSARAIPEPAALSLAAPLLAATQKRPRRISPK